MSNKKQFNKPRVVKISLSPESGTFEIEQMNVVEDKKWLENMAAEKLVTYLNDKKKSTEIIERDREEPDFVIQIVGENYGLELCELMSPREASLREFNKDYQREVQAELGENILLKLLPLTAALIPVIKSGPGKELLAEIFEFYHKYEKSVHKYHGIIGGLSEPRFWLGVQEFIVHPKILKADFEYWATLLEKKWLIDYSLKEIKPILLLYRSSAFLDVNELRSIVVNLNGKHGNSFVEVWYMCVMPGTVSDIHQIC